MWNAAKWMGLPALGIAAALALAGHAHADGMQCGNRLISSGDSLHTVRTRCGEPDSAEHRTEIRRIERVVSVPCNEKKKKKANEHCTRVDVKEVEVVIDEWVYDMGPQRFVRHLRFENGRLKTVETGSYGSVKE